jgi:hypothetical protein
LRIHSNTDWAIVFLSNNIRSILTYLIAGLILVSCKKENAGDCFKSTGKDVAEIRFPGTFSEIEVNDKMEVTLFKGTEYKVEVFAGKNIIKNISAKITDGVLKINNNNTCNFVRGYKRHIRINITVPYIGKILNNGVGMFTVDGGFSQDTLKIQTENSGDMHIDGTYDYIQSVSKGSGDVYLTGSCKSLFVYTSGTNFLKADDLLVSDHIFIETLSVGDCFVNTGNLKTFQYNIWRDGNVYYTGNPVVVNSFCDEAAKGKAIKR